LKKQVIEWKEAGEKLYSMVLQQDQGSDDEGEEEEVEEED